MWKLYKYKGSRVVRKKICLFCKKTFYRNKKNTKVFNKQSFCNRQCWLKWFRKENHPQWKKEKKRHCIDCNVNISKRSTGRCNKCNSIKRRLPEEQRRKKHLLNKQISENKRRSLKKNNGRNDFSKIEWEKIKEVYQNKCAICKENKKLTIDHIIPLSLGGENTKSNIQPLCLSCNSRKSNKLRVPLLQEN